MSRSLDRLISHWKQSAMAAGHLANISPVCVGGSTHSVGAQKRFGGTKFRSTVGRDGSLWRGREAVTKESRDRKKTVEKVMES